MSSRGGGGARTTEGAPTFGRCLDVARSEIEGASKARRPEGPATRGSRAPAIALAMSALVVACVRDKKPEPQTALVDAGVQEQAVETSVVVEPATCEESPGVFLFVTPAVPWTGAPLRVVAVSDKPLDGSLDVMTNDGEAGAQVTSNARHGGPPYFWTTQLVTPTAGAW